MVDLRAFGWQPDRIRAPASSPESGQIETFQTAGDVAVEDYLGKGYLKEALINFVALLGWNPGKRETQEIFTLAELKENSTR